MSIRENISMKKIYGSLYDLYVFIGLAKGVDDIKNGRTISLKKLEKEMEELHENSSRRLG